MRSCPSSTRVPAKVLALLLCACTACPAWPQTASLSAPVAQGPAVSGVAGAVPVQLLRAMDLQLDQTALRLGLGPTLPASSLPQPALPDAQRSPSLQPALATALPAPADVRSARSSDVQGAAEALSRAALSTPLGAKSLEPRAEGARVLASAFADPAFRSRAVELLKGQGSLGASVASKLEAVASAAQGHELLRALGRDLAGPAAAGAVLERLFDGAAGRGPSSEAASPEALAEYAARRFAAGRLLPGQSLAVAASASAAARLGRASPLAAPGEQEMYDRVALSPLTNAEREKVVVELFQKAGAKPEEIVLQDTGDGTHNIYVVKKGKTDRIVVVGGHHDRAHDEGHATIDNWTGATMVVSLYQAMKDLPTEATYVFAAFSKEELGLLGSKEFVKRLSSEQKAKVDSMVNLDTLAVDGTFSWKNNSDKSLLERIKKVAAAAALKLAEMTLWGGDSDSSSFRRAGIPAITLLGASNSVIWDVVHGPGDTIKAFSLAHYKNTFEVALALLKSLDAEPIRRPGILVRAAEHLGRSLREALTAARSRA